MRKTDKNALVLKARELRRSPTLPEGLLWQQLRSRPGDLKFRRQHPIGSYIVDFYCPATRLLVEVDGESHGTGPHATRDGIAGCGGRGCASCGSTRRM